jgi:hypothetical protein
MRQTVGFGGAMRFKYSPRYLATDVDRVLSDITYVPRTRDAHRGETRLRSYKYDYEPHIPEA